VWRYLKLVFQLQTSNVSPGYDAVRNARQAGHLQVVEDM
jgi:hypothetical protein